MTKLVSCLSLTASRSFLLLLSGLLVVTASAAVASPPVAGLFVWLKADAGVTISNNVVTQWQDQSPAGHLLTPVTGRQPTRTPNAVNGLPAITFDGTDRMEASPGGTLTNATIYTLLRYNVADSDNDYIYTIGTQNGNGSQMTLSRQSSRRAYHFDGSAAHLSDIEMFPSQQWLVTEQLYGGTNGRQHELYIDSRSALRSQTGFPYTANASTFVLGDWSGPGYRFVGDLVELIVYRRALTLEERRQVETYLRARAGLTAPFPQEAQILSTWNVIQYELNAQPDAEWIFDHGGTRADQPVNADPSILLSDIDVTNKVIWGQFGSGNAPDSMGFVFGYQNRSNFYLFDWKKTTDSYLNFGTASAGMKVRAFHTPGNDPDGKDFWSHPDTNRVTLLRSNNIPWVDGKDYRFTLRFTPGNFHIRVWDGDTILTDWAIADARFGNGRFGYFINSLQNVRFGEVLVGDIEPVKILRIERSPVTSALQWHGGVPPYRIERSFTLAPGSWILDRQLRWQRTGTETDSQDYRFYRIESVGGR